MTKEIVKLSKTKKELFKVSLKGNNEDINSYKTIRNKLTHTKEQAKKLL